MSEDTIYREDAIKAFTVNNKGKRIPYVDCDNFPIEFPLEYIVKTIKELPSADRPQEWIPCSERLPKPYTEVLVCDECGWISLGVYRPCDVTEKDSGWSTCTRIKLPTDEVLAWMPLPKPWKGAVNE